MTKFASVYFNFIRGVAAIAVFFSHFAQYLFSGSLYGNLVGLHFGHFFVMVFFVLSGFLIAYSAERKNNLSEYLEDRLSRLYTIIIPALVVTFILDRTGIFLNAGCYQGEYNPNYYYLRYFIALLNLQELWGLSSEVSGNGPFWSLSYEWWYYVIFGVFVFLKGKAKYIWTIFFIVFVGYKILLLFPIWLFGVAVYKIRNSLPAKVNIILFITSFIIATLYLTYQLDLPFKVYFDYDHKPLFYSNDFLNDWYLGALIALNIYFVKNIDFSISGVIEKITKWVADGTFTLYLFHYPVILFIACVIKYQPQSYMSSIVTQIGIVLLLLWVGIYFENRRPFYKTLFRKIFQFFTTHFTNAQK